MAIGERVWRTHLETLVAMFSGEAGRVGGPQQRGLVRSENERRAAALYLVIADTAPDIPGDFFHGTIIPAGAPGEKMGG